MVINVSLCSSSLNYNVKVFTYGSLDGTCKKRPNFSAFSCRASKLATEDGAAAANYYRVLSLSSTQAGMEEIKRAYRTMALKCHPDVCKDPSMKKQSAEMFVLLQTAYEMLSDPITRAEYDYELGLCKISGQAFKTHSFSDNRFGARDKWEGQIVELRKRSNIRAAEKEGSWGSRLRCRNSQLDGQMQ